MKRMGAEACDLGMREREEVEERGSQDGVTAREKKRVGRFIELSRREKSRNKRFIELRRDIF